MERESCSWSYLINPSRPRSSVLSLSFNYALYFDLFQVVALVSWGCGQSSLAWVLMVCKSCLDILISFSIRFSRGYQQMNGAINRPKFQRHLNREQRHLKVLCNTVWLAIGEGNRGQSQYSIIRSGFWQCNNEKDLPQTV